MTSSAARRILAKSSLHNHISYLRVKVKALGVIPSHRQHPANILSYHTSNIPGRSTVQYIHIRQDSTYRKHMMSNSGNKQVLVMGLKYGPGQDPATWSAEQVLKDFKSQIDEAKEVGFDLEVYPVDTTISHEEVLSDVQSLLQKQHWHGIAIGFGVRGNEFLTALFEKLVNLSVEKVQPCPKFAFPLRPHIVWEAVSRVFDVQAK